MRWVMLVQINVLMEWDESEVEVNFQLVPWVYFDSTMTLVTRREVL